MRVYHEYPLSLVHDCWQQHDRELYFQAFQINEAEIPKSVEEQIDTIMEEINKKKMESIKNKEDYVKPLYFKNYCIDDSDASYYDTTSLEGAKKYIAEQFGYLLQYDYKIQIAFAFSSFAVSNNHI